MSAENSAPAQHTPRAQQHLHSPRMIHTRTVPRFRDSIFVSCRASASNDHRRRERRSCHRRHGSVFRAGAQTKGRVDDAEALAALAQNAAASVPHGSSPTPEDLDDCALSLAVLRVLTTRLARATMQVRCDEDPALLEDYLEQIVADLRADAEALAALAQNAAASVPRGEARLYPRSRGWHGADCGRRGDRRRACPGESAHARSIRADGRR